MFVKYTRSLFVGLFVIVACLFNPPPSESQHRCIKCHSERPGARTMHDALEGKDCFDCHVRGEKLRQKGGIPKEKHEAFLKQRLADPRCTRCHGEKSKVSNESQTKHPVPLSGNAFCPKCQITSDKDRKVCSQCGGALIDLDRIMRLAAVHPDQSLCRQCHVAEGELEKSHVENVGENYQVTNDCLACHEGHEECSGCH